MSGLIRLPRASHPPPPPLVARRSSRSAGRSALAPYPGKRSSSGGGDGSTGLTPCLGSCTVAGFDKPQPPGGDGEGGDALVQLVMSDMQGVRQAIIRRSSTVGQLASVSEAGAVSTVRTTVVAPAVPTRDQSGRAHSLPVRKGKMCCGMLKAPSWQRPACH